MVENENKEVVNNTTKINGMNIAALVLGIVSLVTWCAWFISIPCSILALVFGIIGIKKPGKSMAIGGIVTGAISLAIWVFIFIGAFMFGFIEGIAEDNYYSSSYSSSNYWD